MSYVSINYNRHKINVGETNEMLMKIKNPFRGRSGNSVLVVDLNCKIDPLTAEEQQSLNKCEDILFKGLNTFFEVGKTLLMIRDARLYRAAYPTFEVYCHERWAIGRSYASRLIGAAERVRLLPACAAVRPTNEFQMRPFLKLEPESFPKAWEQAIARAKNGKITSEIIQTLVKEILPQPDRTAKANKRRRAFNMPKGCSIGQILVLLNEAKSGIEKGEMEKAISAIDRVDSLLLGL